MEFTGRLSAFPAPNLLQWALTERVTGSLVVRRSQREKRIGFRSGRIVDCRSNQSQELFGQFLLIHGHLGAEPLARALTMARARSSRSARSSASSASSTSEQLRQSLTQAHLGAHSGSFPLEAGPLLLPSTRRRRSEADRGGCSTPTELLLEGTRWIDELARIREVLIDDGVVVRPGPAGDLGRTLILSPLRATDPRRSSAESVAHATSTCAPAASTFRSSPPARS